MAKRLGAFETVILSIGLLILVSMLLMAVLPRIELFGTQGGTMVQLRTSHVPTMNDFLEWEKEQKQIKKEIISMTGYW